MRLWNLLSDPLMWSGLIEVQDIGVEHPLKLLFMQDEQVIETLSTHTAQKALADGIRSRGVIGRCEHLDITCIRNPCEAHPELAIIITDEVFGPLSKCRSLPKLLCSPRVGGTACDADVGHSARAQFDNKEGLPASQRRDQ